MCFFFPMHLVIHLIGCRTITFLKQFLVFMVFLYCSNTVILVPFSVYPASRALLSGKFVAFANLFASLVLHIVGFLGTLKKLTMWNTRDMLARKKHAAGRMFSVQSGGNIKYLLLSVLTMLMVKLVPPRTRIMLTFKTKFYHLF